ncbi:unnamed protein product [Anisakis simplex]|uniref:Uncharacterized protein n=1 Tax=Anisakis simplex TaxID=6269 RepID=A0A0M3JPZ0_ANISI|nr:unnamed protein product [Anisakis simplex]
MRAVLPKERSSSWGALTAAPDSSSGASPYNLACGLRAVYQGSAFLPAFVVEGCHGRTYPPIHLSSLHYIHIRLLLTMS